MKCGNREKLFAFSEGMADPRESEGMRSHVAHCGECRRIVDEYRRLDAALDGWQASEPSPWFDVRVLASLRESEPPRREFFGLSAVRALAIGALGALLIAGSLIFIRGRRSAQNSQTRPASTVARSMTAAQEVKMYENLPVLENYDVLANLDVLSALPQAQNQNKQ